MRMGSDERIMVSLVYLWAKQVNKGDLVGEFSDGGGRGEKSVMIWRLSQTQRAITPASARDRTLVSFIA